MTDQMPPPMRPLATLLNAWAAVAEAIRLGPAEGPCEQPGCGNRGRGLFGIICDDCLAAGEARARREAIDRVICHVRAALPPRYRVSGLRGADVATRIDRWGPEGAQSAEAAVAAMATGANVILLGPAGCGKTTLGAALLLARAGYLAQQAYLHDEDGEAGEGWRWDQARSCRYMAALALPGARIFHGPRAGDSADLAAARGAAVLLLDDLGLEPVHSTTIELLHERAANELGLIVTTTLGQQAIVQRYGDGTARRIYEGARTIVLGAT